MSNNNDFDNLSKKTLEKLFDEIDDQLCDDLDVDLNEGILSIELDDGETFLINKHNPSSEIWLSSPYSGAWHFKYDGNSQKWTSTRSSDTLIEKLEQDLSVLLNKKISLKI